MVLGLDPIAPLRSRGALAIARAAALLLRYHAARGARPAAEARLGFGRDALVGVGVNDDGRAVCIEHRQGTVAKRHAVRGGLDRRFSAGVRHEVRQVAHVERVIRVGIRRAVRARIEVAACAGESWCFALPDGMQVQAVRSGLQPGHGHRDFHGFHAGHELHVVGAGHGVHFPQFSSAADVVALDLGGRAHLRRRGRDSHGDECGGGDGGGGSSKVSE